MVKAPVRWIIAVSVLAATTARPLVAFEYPLSSEAIREAYFLATGGMNKKVEFFEKYKHQMPAPNSGADVSLIEIETPFSCLVDEIASHPSNDHAEEAEQDYLGKPGCFRVHVEIDFTDTWPKPNDTAATLGDFWKDFKVHLTQRTEVRPRSVQGQPIYNDETLSGYIGATIDVDYDVKKIDPGALTTVDVNTPDGQIVETTFALNGLR